MKVLFVMVLCAFQLSAVLAQEKLYQGIVFDNDSKERIAKVNILNLSTRSSLYDNLQAEFKIGAIPGDVLIFSKMGYLNDTVKVANDLSLVIYLKRTSIPLKEVTINGVADPKKQLEATKKSYSTIYGSIADHDLLTSGGNGGGAGLSIDGLYNMFSFKGRNATRLRAIIDRDYHENIVDYRFTHALVASITGLKEPTLSDFMFKYRPGYYFIIGANDYELIKYIRLRFKRYQKNPDAFSLQPLNN